ncbi:MAG: hypothetical protein LGB52_07445 [Sulfurovum sp.]|nr:hypothetical protein [Sulfurovum sp.]
MVVSHGPKFLVVVHHCALFGENIVPALKLISHGETDVKDKMQQPNIFIYIYTWQELLLHTEEDAGKWLHV